MKVQITWTQQELCHVHNILLSEWECAMPCVVEMEANSRWKSLFSANVHLAHFAATVWQSLLFTGLTAFPRLHLDSLGK